ncbi:MAG: TrmH family RNA methyltransferase [Gammaproteobacteria bacterium]|nr:TrmH family RNA methyltransferase [Gammaproteobacteria bacterium]
MNAGEQLDSQQLYQNQKQKLAQPDFIAGPRIIAAGLRSAENIGSIFRLADAAGCPVIVFINESDDDLVLNQKISKVARNTDKIIETVQMTPADFIASPHLYHPLIAIELTTNSSSVYEIDLPQQLSFMVGNERHGITSDLLGICDRAVHIPMFGTNGSMNVSHALGICLFEWRRQTAMRELL